MRDHETKRQNEKLDIKYDIDVNDCKCNCLYLYFIITRRHRYSMRIYRHTYTLSNVWISTKRGNKAWRISRQMTACTASLKSGYFPDGWFCLSLVQKYSQPRNPIPKPPFGWDKLLTYLSTGDRRISATNPYRLLKIPTLRWTNCDPRQYAKHRAAFGVPRSRLRWM